jgi:hypothetical protein
MAIAIPSHWATAGYGIPTVCAKHGRPEVQRRGVSLETATPDWNYLLLFLGIVAFFIVRAATAKTLAVRAWPFCETCVRQRFRFKWYAAGVVAVGLALFVAALRGLAPAWAVLAAALIVVGSLALVRGGWIWRRMSSAKLSEDAAWITVVKPHPGFEEQFAPYAPAAAELWNVSANVRSSKPASVVPWILALIVGPVCLLGGVVDLVAGPTCGDERMRPGDTCEETSSRGSKTESTYAAERQTGNLMGGAGALAVVGGIAGIVVTRRRNRARAARSGRV